MAGVFWVWLCVAGLVVWDRVFWVGRKNPLRRAAMGVNNPDDDE